MQSYSVNQGRIKIGGGASRLIFFEAYFFTDLIGTVAADIFFRKSVLSVGPEAVA